MLVNENFKLLDSQTKSRGGGKAAKFVAMTFLARFIGIFIYRVLTDKKEGTKEEACKYAIDNLADAKSKLQDAVAAGFQGAMTTFAGKQIEYYCQVKIVPPVISKHQN